MAASNGQRAKGGRYLSFTLGEEAYGIPIESVCEINALIKVTHVPEMPAFAKGVINLRGKVVPVIDLRTKLHMKEAEHTRETCIIIVDSGIGNIGVIVDTVKEVLDLSQEQIEPRPPMGDPARTRFLMGLGKLEEKLVILVDIAAVLSPEEMGLLHSSVEAA